MASSLYLIGVFFASVTLIHYVNLFLTSRRFAQFAQANGCASPVTKRFILPFGAERVLRLLTFKGDLLDDLLGQGFKRAQSWTHALSIPVQPTPVLITADPKNVQAVLATNFEDWEVGQRRRSQFAPFLGMGIFTADGQSWANARKIVRPSLARDQIGDLELMERHVGQLLRVYGGVVTPDGWTDFKDVKAPLFRHSLDISSDFLFGESADSQHAISTGGDGLSAKNSMIRFNGAFDVASRHMAVRMTLGPLYWFYDYHVAFRRACSELRVEAQRLVRNALDKLAQEKARKEVNTSSRGRALRDLAQYTQDPEELREQLMHILFAGRDSVAATICWCLVNLAQSPGAWEKLRSEVLEQVGTFENSRCGEGEALNLNSLKACTYLHSVVQETLRLQPPVSVNIRQAVRDNVLPTGGGPNKDQPIAVQKGTSMIMAVYEMHRREDLWGPDSREWKPERWQGLRQSWNFIPFHGGPRHCPGEQLARTETTFTLCRIVQFFDKIELLNPLAKVPQTTGLTMQPKGDVMMRFHRASA